MNSHRGSIHLSTSISIFLFLFLFLFIGSLSSFGDTLKTENETETVGDQSSSFRDTDSEIQTSYTFEDHFGSYLPLIQNTSTMADPSTEHHKHSHHHHEDQDHDHGHGHDGTHSHQEGDAFTELNRAHWNKFAASYSSEPWQRELLQKVNAFIFEYVNWIGVDFLDPAATFERKPVSGGDDQRKVRVLDYACGPGTITHALGNRASEYVGVDLSENMVKAYNLRFNPEQTTQAEDDDVDAQQDETLTAHAVVGNLLSTNDPSPPSLSDAQFFDFDLVVVGLGFHHFQDIPLATKRLVQRLRPGGVFLILDFVTHAMEDLDDDNDKQKQAGEIGHGHGDAQNPVKHTVAHNGFSEEELKTIFEGAGLTEFKLVRSREDVLIRGKTTRRPFLARGRKVGGGGDVKATSIL